ncbi:universal stress protein [Geobacter sp. SVR]|uniref:universal stress protein n=1 Tax=Geobacter sp. SVR TaxID=2495594 RepID=UPI00143EF83F|nr:universal stress protein [Geobacter sp. SVR]BCS52757.1 universal stress protein A [Geobacter sp. SVR]GCF86747.1 universal stress protein A [Geobacter sp. SVR]
MPLKDILLHLDNTAGCPARLELAVSLARTHNAHLTGIYVLPHQYYAPRHEIPAVEAAQKAGALFAALTGQAGVSAEWVVADGDVVGVSLTEILNAHVYYSDLVIVGQPEHDSLDRNTPPDLPERLGLGAGRPLLVVPHSRTFASIGERVMIAWKSGRESARATNDALPLLEKSNRISVVTVSPAGNPDDTDRDNAARICSHLSRHGLQACHEQIRAGSGTTVGGLLLNHACERNVDLLVVGGYAPSRRGAYVMGPVARHLMNHMTVPVLLSH